MATCKLPEITDADVAAATERTATGRQRDVHGLLGEDPLVALGLLHLKIQDVESVIYLKIAAHMLCVQCIKSGLSLP